MEMPIDIPEWVPVDEQTCSLGSHEWSVPRLITLTKDLPIMDVNMNHLHVFQVYEKLTLREMVMHMRVVRKANLEYPIILDEDGELMDGRHRIMKALYLGKSTIKAVRFVTNPSPCRNIK